MRGVEREGFSTSYYEGGTYRIGYDRACYRNIEKGREEGGGCLYSNGKKKERV